MAVLCLSVFCACRGAKAQTTITFDDDPADGQGNGISNGYKGLNWDDGFGGGKNPSWGLVDGTHYGLNPSGYQPARVSGDFVAYAIDMGFSSPTAHMIFNSVWITSAWRDGLTVEVDGYVGGVLTYQQLVNPSATAPTLYSFNWAVDSVEFHGSGGVQHAGYTPINAPDFALDDLTVTTPEGNSAVLVCSGLLPILGVPFLRRRRNRTK
jgi:hypothetical protein